MATRTELALATILALFSGVVVYGQVDRANLNGTVMDSSRAVVADARVEVVSRETGLKRAANTGPGKVDQNPPVVRWLLSPGKGPAGLPQIRRRSVGQANM